MSGEQDQSQPPHQIMRAARLVSKLGWLGPASLVGAVVTSFWLLYIVFEARGFLAALLAFVFLGFCYGFGPAPMFAVASSFLCFYFQVVGVWLPVLSYFVAAITLYLAIKVDRAQKIANPFDT